MLHFSKRFKFKITSSWRATSLLGICVTLLLIATSITQASSTWTLRTSGTTSQLRDVIYTGSQYVAVGTGGTILTSPDSVTWTTRTSGTTSSIMGITFGGGQFVAVGLNNTILTSPDGVTWTAQDSGFPSSEPWWCCFSATYAAGQYVISGDFGRIITSPDGVTWTQHNAPTGNSINAVTYGGGQFVAVSGFSSIWTSPDAVTWTGQTSGTTKPLESVVYGGGKYVTVGGEGTILTSPDAITWTAQTSPTLGHLRGVIYAGGQFVATGGSGITTSPDGINWTHTTTVATFKAAFSGTQWVAVGDFGNILGMDLPLPTLSIPNSQRNAAQGSFSVPINLTSNGASIAAVGFTLNYDQTCLSFDATDNNSDGVPDAITGLPSGFIPSITPDANAGALNIGLVDNTAPINALSDGALLTVAFNVKPACVTTDGSTHSVTLSFANDPAPSFSDPTGHDVNGTSNDATIPLQFNATPTAINLSNNSVAENAASGTTVGTLSTTDLDVSDTHTYTLVTGTGDTDNASFTLTGNTLKTAASFDFETKQSYTIRIRTTDNGGPNGTFEQAFTINVTNVNEAPTAVDDANDPVTTVFVGGQATPVDVLANDTDPENDSLSIQSINITGTQGSVTNNGTNVSYTAPNSNGSSSFTYQAGDGTLTSNSATVHTTYVKNDARGDCNGNGNVTAADFIATVLEIFDTNDTKYNSNTAWWLIYTGDYAGSPRGCDSNAGQNGLNHTSDSVSAGDIICTVLTFFKQTCGSGAVLAASPVTTPQVAVANTSATRGQAAKVTVQLNTASNQVAAATFALVVDPSKLSFDTTDADADGIPDAVKLNVPSSMSKSVTWNAAQSRLEVALFGASLPLPTLSDGPLATVNFQVAVTANPGATEVGLQLVSLSDTAGQDLTVDQSNGTLTISANPARALLYLPVVAR